jgi:response regulator RpfG family c-di-GMP phosphodiesterase
MKTMWFTVSFIFAFLAAGNSVGDSSAHYQRISTSLLAIGVVIIAALVAVIVFLYRKKNKLKLKVETQEIELEKKQAYVKTLVNDAIVEIKERELEMINRLISALEYRDIETANHITRMSNYSRLIAKNLFPADSAMVGLIYLSAALHDIGKIGISDNILSKPEKLSNEEFNEMKRHTLIGYDILKESASEVIQLSALIALSHHERFDGKGYPRGLKGKEIPIAGRIVAVADYFDALVSKRVYKDAWSIEKVLEVLKERQGSYFDPICVNAFFDSLEEILEIKDKYPDTHRLSFKDIEIEDEIIDHAFLLSEPQKTN